MVFLVAFFVQILCKNCLWANKWKLDTRPSGSPWLPSLFSSPRCFYTVVSTYHALKCQAELEEDELVDAIIQLEVAWGIWVRLVVLAVQSRQAHGFEVL